MLSDAIPPFSNPHFLAAREIVAEALIGAGDLERAAALGGQPESDWTALMRSFHALVAAWIAAASGDREGAKARAGIAAEHARSIGAAWWLARAQAVLSG